MPPNPRRPLPMDDAELERIARRVIELMPPPRRSPWTAPAIILALLTQFVGAVYVYGKQSDHIESLDARVKGVEDATFSQKDAGVALGNLKDQIGELQKRDERLEADVRALLIQLAQSRK